jgi:3-dehydroquinate dehydratase I
MNPLICVSIGKASHEEISLILRQSAMAEIRMDLLDLNADQFHRIFSSHSNLVATCRPGIYREDRRAELLQNALKSGAAFVDLEIETSDKWRKQIQLFAESLGRKTIVSWHNYEQTPPAKELRSIVQSMFDSGADLAKIACYVNSPRDIAILLGLYSEFTNLVAIGMGKQGIITRLAAPLLGAPFTFAGMDAYQTADGQLNKSQMEEFYNFYKSTGSGKL